MNNIDLGLIFLVLAVIGAVLKKTYFSIPIKELRRRAKDQEKTAIKLYKVAIYDYSLKVLLWLYIVLTSSTSFILFAKSTPLWLSVPLIGFLIYLIFSLIPSLHTSKLSIGFAKIISPILSWFLYYLHPLINRTKYLLKPFSQPKPVHTGIYDKQDLVGLLKKQKKQSSNRISDMEISIALNSLNFSDRKVSDILVPKKKVKTILSDAVIGPVLINEIHESGQSYVLVKDKKENQIVGTLAFIDLNIKSVGLVEDIMDKKVYFIHEDDSLLQALASLYEAKYHLLVVVNSFEEFVGIITIERILEELLGRIAIEKNDDYISLTKTASKFTKDKD